MKKIFTAACALLIAGTAMAAIPYKHFVVIMKTSGDKVEHAFTEDPVATFEGAEMIMTVNHGEEKFNYPMADVKSITIRSEYDAVESVESSVSQSVAYDGETIRVSGIQAGAAVSVYSLDGKLMISAKADADGAASFSVAALPSGAYIVRAANNTFKFIK